LKQSTAADAGAGDDSTTAPTVVKAPMMEAKESRRDCPIDASLWSTTGVDGFEFLIASGASQVFDAVWRNENPSAEETNTDAMMSWEVKFFIVKEIARWFTCSTFWNASCRRRCKDSFNLNR